jgi:hypothetical protein
VEAPGVEGRGEASGFDGFREGSRGGAGESTGFLSAGESVNEVSQSFAQLQCSSVVESPPNFGYANDIEWLRARLDALEAALPLIAALLSNGDVRGALAVVRGLREGSGALR